MTAPIFDQSHYRIRQARAAHIAGDQFLRARAFNDCLDRLAGIAKDFTAALIVGMVEQRWIEALRAILPDASVIPSASDAELMQLAPGSFDLCLSIGDLETRDDLSTAAFSLRHLLAPDGLLLGAIVGGDSLPRLRSAMLVADRALGVASPRIHPSIDGASLSALLGSVGLIQPVIDVDRVDVSYASLDRLVADLRAMGCTNILAGRSRRPLTRRQLQAARAAFLGGKDRVDERFEILHFAAWAPRS